MVPEKFKVETIVEVILLILALLPTLTGNFLSQVHATFVTGDNDWITVENDYYIAKIDKNVANKHGHIREFYIKPEDTINIVATSQWKFLGGHEAHSAWGETFRVGTDWAKTYKRSETTRIVEQTSSYVVVETFTQFGRLASHLNYTVVEYTTFFSDKEYYIVTSTRTYQEDIQRLDNYEYCFLFNDTWVSDYYYLDHDRTIGHSIDVGYPPFVHEGVLDIWEARHLEAYPWVMVWNSTYGVGHYTILVSANPTTIGLGYLYLVIAVGLASVAVLCSWEQINIRSKLDWTQVKPRFKNTVHLCISDMSLIR